HVWITALAFHTVHRPPRVAVLTVHRTAVLWRRSGISSWRNPLSGGTRPVQNPAHAPRPPGRGRRRGGGGGAPGWGTRRFARPEVRLAGRHSQAWKPVVAWNFR